MATPVAKHEAVEILRKDYLVSLRRACGLVNMSASSFYYRPKVHRDRQSRIRGKRLGNYNCSSRVVDRQLFLGDEERNKVGPPRE